MAFYEEEFGCGLQNMTMINPFSSTIKHGGNHTDSLEFEYFCCSIVFVRGKRGNVRQTYEHSSVIRVDGSNFSFWIKR